MDEDKPTTVPSERVTIDELFKQLEQARIAREQPIGSAPPRGLIVPYSHTMPATRVDL